MQIPFVPTDGMKYISVGVWKDLLGKSLGARIWLQDEKNRREMKRWLRDQGFPREFEQVVDRNPRNVLGRTDSVDIEKEAKNFEGQVRMRGVRMEDAGRVKLPGDWLQDVVTERYKKWYEEEYIKTREQRMRSQFKVWDKPGMSASFGKALKLPWGYRFRGMRIDEVPVQYLLRLVESRDWHRLPQRVKLGILNYMKLPGVVRRAEGYLGIKYDRDWTPGGWEEIEDVAERYEKGTGRTRKKPYDMIRRAFGDFGVSDVWGTYRSVTARQEQFRLPGQSVADIYTMEYRIWEAAESNFKKKMFINGEWVWVDQRIGGFRPWEQRRQRRDEPAWMEEFDEVLGGREQGKPIMNSRGEVVGYGIGDWKRGNTDEEVGRAYRDTRPGSREFERMLQQYAKRLPPGPERREWMEQMREYRQRTIQDEQLEYLEQRREVGDPSRDYLGRLGAARTRAEMQQVLDEMQKVQPFGSRDLPEEFHRAYREKWNLMAGEGVNVEAAGWFNPDRVQKRGVELGSEDQEKNWKFQT